MRILTVCRKISRNEKLHQYAIAEFIYEQNEKIAGFGVEFDYYLIEKGGVRGYFYHTLDFIRLIKQKGKHYDIIHSHGGHIGSLVNIQRKIPVITTYHGTDINKVGTRLLSLISLIFSRKNIFVSAGLLNKVRLVARGEVIPCGVNFNDFKPLDKSYCRNELGYNQNEKIILFSGQRGRKIKNFKLADKAAKLSGVDKMIELKGLNRDQVVKTINACDLILLTSISEGSPMIIKEAMACNCPIVSTDVGDVKEVIGNTEGCFICSFDSQDAADKIETALRFGKRTNGRENIKHLEIGLIATKVFDIYKSVLK